MGESCDGGIGKGRGGEGRGVDGPEGAIVEK